MPIDYSEDVEEKRLQEAESRSKNWKRWGPYLSERQWATVREDYSPKGESWRFFPHEHARSRAYRWGEDGLLGITDRECRLCFALALWNGKDPILKERLFGLTEPEGNHGEDVKECYYYLDSLPTHSYMKALYKYPQKEYPYKQLVEENQARGVAGTELELIDTGIFDGNQYFDVLAEYAKSSPNNILIRITITNQAKEEADLHFLPTLWFRNTWIWGCESDGCTTKPLIQLLEDGSITTTHSTLEKFYFFYEKAPDKPIDLLFTENVTNEERLFGIKNETPYAKDAFHDYVISGKKEAVNPAMHGTKCAPYYKLHFKPGEAKTIRLRLVMEGELPLQIFGEEFDQTFEERIRETDAFYAKKIPASLSQEEKNISRQAYAGLLWTKQFYQFVVKEWLDGDPNEPVPPKQRLKGRNRDWTHLFARDVISMPDKWEYPWFAAWDLAFHMIPFAKIDPYFSKMQMILFLREWYMHPNGQQPAYEFNLSDVNPPVHAWAAWRIYKISGKKGERDLAFLESVFQKQLINFTWWVNRKDFEGNNLFSGGFLGMDNIGVFNRSEELPTGGILQQADGTAWMAFYCLTMLNMALELSVHNHVYEDLASKFFEHFIRITDSMNQVGGHGLWDEEDGFYYDQLKLSNGQIVPLKTRSLVGLLPLIAVEILEESHVSQLPGFLKRMKWFLNHRKDLEKVMSYCEFRKEHHHRLLAIPSHDRLRRMLRYMLDEEEFLSPYGIRSMSKVHEKKPFSYFINGEEHRVEYVPGESNSYLFGGNSNWRGPIWFPTNYLIIEALERYHLYYGDNFKVECPTGSGKMMNLQEVADEISNRLTTLFIPSKEGIRPCHGQDSRYAKDPLWKDLILYHEYFHADSGKGLGASHQTGWTALVAKLLENRERRL